MTQDEIEHMWKIASNDPNHDTNWHDPVVIAFAKLVVAKEREAIAQMVEPWLLPEYVEKIRARSTHD
jgi:hypothetical protein